VSELFFICSPWTKCHNQPENKNVKITKKDSNEHFMLFLYYKTTLLKQHLQPMLTFS